MEYILVIDQGTTSTRAIIFDASLNIVAKHQLAFKQYFPQIGWVEHDAEEIWQSVQFCIESVLKQASLTPKQITALGITNQRETTVLWEQDTGKPVCPAIVWQDRRTETICEAWRKQGLESLVQTKTGLLIDPYFSASKLAWLFQQNAKLKQRAQQGELAFGTIESFLVWRLTQGKQHISDISNASRTLLFNIHTQEWDNELLKVFDIPSAILPKVVDNAGKLASANILDTEVAITGMVGDQQAALIGQGATEVGKLKITYGTGGFLLLNTGRQAPQSKEKLLTTVAYRVPHHLAYALEASIFSVGTIIEWLRDQLGVIKNSADSDQMAASLADNGGVFCIPAFTGLGAPHWKADSRAAFYGIGRDTTKAHFVRASLEAIVYQTQEVMLAMQKDISHKIEHVYCDGGVSKNNWLLQFLADITQLKIIRPENIEATATGAAILAGMGARIFENFAQTELAKRKTNIFLPKMKKEEAIKKYQQWQYWLKQHLAIE